MYVRIISIIPVASPYIIIFPFLPACGGACIQYYCRVYRATFAGFCFFLTVNWILTFFFSYSKFNTSHSYFWNPSDCKFSEYGFSPYILMRGQYSRRDHRRANSHFHTCWGNSKIFFLFSISTPYSEDGAAPVYFKF